MVVIYDSANAFVVIAEDVIVVLARDVVVRDVLFIECFAGVEECEYYITGK